MTLKRKTITQPTTFKIKMINSTITCHQKPDDKDACVTKNITGANIQTNANTYIKNAKEQTLIITLQTVNIIQ